MAHKGKYTPRNPKKILGDPTKIIYRSGLERSVMSFLDRHNDCIAWGSEVVIIPYRSPLDNKYHRYFMDFVIHMKKADGTIDVVLCEVKPRAQTMPPVKKSRITRRYLTEVKTWGVNQAKWNATREYVDKRGWKFMILTEKEIRNLE